MDNKIRDSILKELGKVVQIGIVLIVCSVAAVGQDRMATLEKSSAVYKGVPINQDTAQSTVLNKVISIKVQDIPLLEAVKKIAVKANLKMVYNSKLMATKKRRITVNLKQVTVAKALWTVLEETGLRFAVAADKQLVLLKQKEVKVSSQIVLEVVSGEVTDAESGETLPGVNILVKGTSTGASTDQDGNFELEVPSLQDTLVVTYIGYQEQEVAINGQTEIEIQMVPEAIMGEEMVVVGYGTQQRENVTGSIEQISGDGLAEQATVQTSSALMGKVSGVQVIQNSGQPGGNDGTIRIRGIGTLGNANPLVLIDGVEGDLDDIPASDIENISVLKDAASAAVYGSRAANGVILITTKRGTREDFQISYKGSMGLRKATNQPGFVDGGTFMRLSNLASENVGKQPSYSEEYIQEWEANHESDPIAYPNTDWVDLLFNEPGIQQMHNLMLNGGGKKYSMRGSLQYDSENGEVENFSFQRYNIRLNTNVEASEKMMFNLDLNAIRNDKEEPSTNFGQIFRDAYRLRPIALAYWSDGSYGPGVEGRNPLAAAAVRGLKTSVMTRLRGRFVGEYDPISKLQLKLVYAPSYNSTWLKSMNKIFESTNPETGEIVATRPTQNSLRESFSRSFQHNVTFTADFRENIANHNIGILVGSEYIDYRYDTFGAWRDNFLLQDYEELNAGSAVNQQNHGSANQSRLLSFFGRLDYSFNNKYLFKANLRYDGSSRFVEDNRWGVFPSFSLGWRISQEPFMDDVGFIDEFKLRGSWGKLGNQKIGNYPFIAEIQFGENYIFGNEVVDGAGQQALANTNITWEEAKTTNVGFDLSFLNKLDFTFDWYKKTTNDILLKLPIPMVIGLEPPFRNAAVVENTGWESQVAYRDIIGQDFSFNIEFNISNVENKVVDLNGAGPFISGSAITKVGSPINSLYGYESDGLFQSQNEVDNHATQRGQVAPGDIKYVDQNDDGVINANDRVVIGDPFPSMNYGINISANYRQFDFSVFLQGVGSRDVRLSGDAVFAFYNGGRIKPWMIESYWTAENPDNDYPRLTNSTQHSNFDASDYWMYDASYLRLRNLQFGYAIPTSITDKLAFKKARIYINGQNLFTLFDNMPPGIDPNITNNTVGNYYGVTKLYGIGINIDF